jgi:hypothetical protein
MTVTDETIEAARVRMEGLRQAGHAVRARHDARRARILITLDSGVELAIPVRLLEGLEGAQDVDLGEIEISPSGLGLHWPSLDADVYVPALLQGVFGSRHWMARVLGAEGGRAKSPAKTMAARENGRKGGRPPKDSIQGNRIGRNTSTGGITSVVPAEKPRRPKVNTPKKI